RQESKDVKNAKKLINSCIASDLKQLQQSQSSDSAEVLYRLAADQAVAQNAAAAIKYLKESIATGWLDYRSPKLDPRFDFIATNSQFKKLLDDLATRVADHRRQSHAEKVANKIN